MVGHLYYKHPLVYPQSEKQKRRNDKFQINLELSKADFMKSLGSGIIVFGLMLLSSRPLGGSATLIAEMPSYFEGC